MKTFLILALLAVAATMATAKVQFDPRSWQYQQQQPFPQLQQPFPQLQQPFPQQQPFSQEQQQFPEQQQPFSQLQQPFPQLKQPFPQQQPFSQEQQQFPEQQQPFLQQQPQFFQPFLQQQLNPCREFIVQRCSPVAMKPFHRSQSLQQSSCQVMRQQCCRQLVQIPEQLRCPAIHSIVHAIIMQQQQQFFQPQQRQMGQGFFQPQAQKVGQGFIQSPQLAQLEAMRTFALQTISAMCNVQVPAYYSTAPFGDIGGF